MISTSEIRVLPWYGPCSLHSLIGRWCKFFWVAPISTVGELRVPWQQIVNCCVLHTEKPRSSATGCIIEIKAAPTKVVRMTSSAISSPPPIRHPWSTVSTYDWSSGWFSLACMFCDGMGTYNQTFSFSLKSNIVCAVDPNTSGWNLMNLMGTSIFSYPTSLLSKFDISLLGTWNRTLLISLDLHRHLSPLPLAP